MGGSRTGGGAGTGTAVVGGGGAGTLGGGTGGTVTVGVGGGAGTVGAGGAGTGGTVTVGTETVGTVTLTVGSGGTWALLVWTSTCAAAKPLRATIRPSNLPNHFIRRRPPDRGVCNYNAFSLQRGAASIEPVLALLGRCGIRRRHHGRVR
ncbi:MAG TPA: hypothetical protein VNP89_01045, partial [Gaiellaceae bacterium]|nr:hypothetical protein [Gaiellaceae bacterium]